MLLTKLLTKSCSFIISFPKKGHPMGVAPLSGALVSNSCMLVCTVTRNMDFWKQCRAWYCFSLWYIYWSSIVLIQSIQFLRFDRIIADRSITLAIQTASPYQKLGGGWGGGGKLGVNCGAGVRAKISKPTPFIYLAFEKRTHSYTWSSKMLTYSYIVLWFFYTHLLLVVDKYRSQFIEYKENKQRQKIYERINTHIYTGMPEKWGLSHTNLEKIGSVIYFLLKKGANHIPGSAEKGPFGTHIPSPPPPPTPTSLSRPTPSETRSC